MRHARTGRDNRCIAPERNRSLAFEAQHLRPRGLAMVSKDFLIRLEGYGLTTAAIHYHMPDHPKLLQLYVWQDYDLAPLFPGLKEFLQFWQRELEGALHSVRVAHDRMVKPSEWKAVNGLFLLN
jgi:uncharacterized protein Usg